ncbi:hypothetical protein [Natrinema sp. DC36]|uniref:hypothetical protein n=1 Tax=Natrinema sp. DC36 TaxID=2878680 RepID=UPI001CF07F41|nr:hypothetical protein [Natrinema sp. DC36]
MTDQDLRKTLEDVLTDLRSYDPLVTKLEGLNPTAHGQNAIQLSNETSDPFENPVGAEDDFNVVVVPGVMTETGSFQHKTKQSTFRIQVDVGGRLAWRKDIDAEAGSFAQLELAEVLGLVGDRMDTAAPVDGGSPGGSDGSPVPREDDDGSLTISEDWLLSVAQTDN